MLSTVINKIFAAENIQGRKLWSLRCVFFCASVFFSIDSKLYIGKAPLHIGVIVHQIYKSFSPLNLYNYHRKVEKFWKQIRYFVFVSSKKIFFHLTIFFSDFQIQSAIQITVCASQTSNKCEHWNSVWTTTYFYVHTSLKTTAVFHNIKFCLTSLKLVTSQYDY